MGRTLINPLSTVEWNSNFSCQIDVKGKITIEMQGSLSGESLTASDVNALIPSVPPAAIVGATYATKLALANRSFTKDDSGFVEISATYEGTETESNQIGAPGGDESNTRYELRGTAVERDITTHPAFADYSESDKQAIAAIFSGDAYPNPAYTNSGAGITSWEFVRNDPQTEKVVQVNVGSSGTSDLTPIEMARLIVCGVRTYLGPTVTASRSYTQRNPLESTEIDKIGKIKPSIPGITVPGGRKWLISGLSQSNTTSNSYEISEEFILSEDGGPNDKIYEDA